MGEIEREKRNRTRFEPGSAKSLLNFNAPFIFSSFVNFRAA